MDDEAKAIHEEAAELFRRLPLTYRFATTLLEGGPHPTMRFLFSKPTARAPVPPFTVSCDVKHQGRSNEGEVLYSVLMEGEHYVHRVAFDPSHVTGSEFNERFWL